ncbi:hypothetical protein OEZ86_004998 [Tetradesmus obliquus]|nr:hypothetical protein OEZ86_004998 [Tetradesmus obliquus]
MHLAGACLLKALLLPSQFWEDTIFRENTASKEGGGVYVQDLAKGTVLPAAELLRLAKCTGAQTLTLAKETEGGLVCNERAGATPAPPAAAAAAAAAGDDDSKVEPAELLRPLVLFLQYLLIVSTLDVQCPDTISYAFRALACAWSPASPESMSIDCVLPSSSRMPLAVQKILFILLVPGKAD